MSHAYQGYARMASFPSPDYPKPDWYRSMRRRLCDPFCVEWIVKTTVNHDYVPPFRNTLNLDLPMTRARDCQELDDFCGRNLVQILNKQATRAD